MLICKEHKFAFVHIQKSGGISVTFALSGYIRGPKVNAKSSVLAGTRFHRAGSPQHSTMSYNAGLVRKDWTVACTIRDPWSRFRSLARRLVNFREPDAYGNWILGEGESLNECAIRVERERVHRPIWGAGDLACRPQLEWARGCNCIMRLETLEKDFHDFCQRVKIPTPPLAHVNRGAYPDDFIYNQAGLEAVAKLYEQDIKHFGFTMP